MTVKELSEVAGVSKDTILRTARKIYPEDIRHGVVTKFDEHKSIEIMKIVRKKNLVDTQTATVEKQTATVDYEVIGKMIGMAISSALAPLVEKLDKVTEQKKEQLQLEAPKMDPRATITKNINDYVAKTGTSYRDAYTLLYRDFGYRTHCNPSLSAKNRNMKIIDYIDSEGQLDVLAAVSKELN